MRDDGSAPTAALLLASLAGASAELDSISLNGEWGLTLDQATTDAQGLTWWSLPNMPAAPPSFNASKATIRVPGLSVGAAGFGDDAADREHQYSGSVFYTKQVTLPASWAAALTSSSISLQFGGVMRSMHLWVNGKRAGSHFGYMDPFEFDITAHAREAAQAESGGIGLNIVARVSGGNNATYSGDGLGGTFDQGSGLWMCGSPAL